MTTLRNDLTPAERKLVDWLDTESPGIVNIPMCLEQMGLDHFYEKKDYNRFLHVMDAAGWQPFSALQEGTLGFVPKVFRQKPPKFDRQAWRKDPYIWKNTYAAALCREHETDPDRDI